MGNVKSRLHRSRSSSSTPYIDRSSTYPCRRIRDVGRQKSESEIANSRLGRFDISRGASLLPLALPSSGILLGGLCSGGVHHDRAASYSERHSAVPGSACSSPRSPGPAARPPTPSHHESPLPDLDSLTQACDGKHSTGLFYDEQGDAEDHLPPYQNRSGLALCLPFDLCSQSRASSGCSSPAALVFPAQPGESLSRYDPTGQTLGRGAFGTVRVCRDSATGGEVAVKTISKRVAALENPDFAEDLRQEVAIMRFVSQNEVVGAVRLLDVRESREHVHLVMERCNAGSLSAVIKSRQRLLEHEAADVIRQLLTTVAGLHSLGVIHRDLKPENVLLCYCGSCRVTCTAIDEFTGDCGGSDGAAREGSSCSSSESSSGSGSSSPWLPSCPSSSSYGDSDCTSGGCNPPNSHSSARAESEWRVKIADFGLAVRLPAPSAQIRGVAGTAFYMAPEVARGRLYGREADMWSLGVVLHVLLSGRLPFYGRTDDETRKRACAGHVMFSDKHWEGVSGAAREAVLQMLTVEPRWRATAEQVLRCDWLRETEQC
ncbi:hypothetical protein CLOM_g24132 [Closterium sp. NIES-68]|nr:hypothetical protein CLOM_g24132 [Closterium sp. NIES-68]GJP84672.1 hypothetical protein CLOP_g14716 [Closterium sp. NIES-67]